MPERLEKTARVPAGRRTCMRWRLLLLLVLLFSAVGCAAQRDYQEARDLDTPEAYEAFLKEHPDHRMVVIAGNGHLTFGSGIPKRTFRRNGYAYALILNDVDIEQGIADFVIYPETIEPVTAPKMMVMLTEKENAVTISGFARGSVSEKAGLKKGDRILSVDGEAITDVQDLRISLFYKAKEDILKVKVLRKRFLFGDRELEFEVKLR